MNTNQLIVVGVDGSDGGRRALEWAVREAAGRGSAIQAVMAWSRDGLDYAPWGLGCGGLKSIQQKPTSTPCPDKRQHHLVHAVTRQPLLGRPLHVGE